MPQQLSSQLSTTTLFQLIKDVHTGAGDYTFLPNDGSAYVSTHEVALQTDQEIVNFSASIANYLSGVFGKTVPPSRYTGNTEAGYSTFSTLFSSQSGLVRLLWLNNKIISMLIGNKPQRIYKKTEKGVASETLTYSPYYFGFSEDSLVNKTLSEEDKAKLMLLPEANWLVNRAINDGMSKSALTVLQNTNDSFRSISVANGYIRHAAIEKEDGSTPKFLIFPKHGSSFFQDNGCSGSGVPYLVNLMATFNYQELLESAQSINTGEWHRHKEYDNGIFLSEKNSLQQSQDKTYFKIDFKSTYEFHEKFKTHTSKNIITRKYPCLNPEDTKYFDNPRYDIVYSDDKSMFFIAKSDKLKATALQTRITKSLREDFIIFLNWLGYYSFAADLDKAQFSNFAPRKLTLAKQSNWAEPSLNTLSIKKGSLLKDATELFKDLYMGTSLSCVTPLQDTDLFALIYNDHGSKSSYRYAEKYDPVYMLPGSTNNSGNMLSFNKKFSLDIDLYNIATMFSETENRSGLNFLSTQEVMSFFTTNFLLTDKVEQILEKGFDAFIKSSRNIIFNSMYAMNAMNKYHFSHDGALDNGQLLKTCVTLSDETLAIFNSVASLNTPSDIISWLELSKEHFTKVLPGLLVAKYGNLIADEKRISSLLSAGIEYYSLILSAAEPFSNKLLQPDDSTEN